MKIAIPLFGDRVSPRFDCASKLLIATVEKSKVIDRKELFIENFSFSERLENFGGMGINVLICGAIDNFSNHYLTDHHIKIISWVTGDAQESLGLFLSGDLKPGYIRNLGRCHKRRRFRKRRGQSGSRW